MVFEWDWAFCPVVTSLNKRNCSRCIHGGWFGEQIISEQVETSDPSIFEGRVREVGFEARGYDEAEMRTCWEARIGKGTETDGGGGVRQ
jgi:hypothetical protein